MKTTHPFAWLLIACLACVACQTDETPAPPSAPVSFSASIAIEAGIQPPTTRTAGNTWLSTDAIGIFMLDATTATPFAANKRHLASAGANAQFTAQAGNEIHYPADGTTVRFIAYYPHTPGAADLATPLTIDLPTTQTDATHAANDWLYAAPATVYSKSTTGNVPLSFNHLLAKLTMTCQAGAGVASLDGLTVAIDGLNTRCNLDLQTGTTASPANPANSIVPRTLTPEQAYDAIVVPAGYAKDAVQVVFTLGTGESYTWKLDAIDFLSGNDYSYTVTLSETGVRATGEVNGWTTTPQDGITVELPEVDYAELLEDDVFRGYCIENFDTDQDGKLSYGEVMGVKNIGYAVSLNFKGIQSLKGVKYFRNLEYLNCSNNSLTSLDVSGLTELMYLYCMQNSLTSLDVSGLKKLTMLHCAVNSLNSLDVSSLTILRMLQCNHNPFAELDVSANNALQTLACGQSDDSKKLTVWVDSKKELALSATVDKLYVQAVANSQGSSYDTVDSKDKEFHGVTVKDKQP